MSKFKKILSFVISFVIVIACTNISAEELTPFRPLKIPGMIDGCDFDNGGENVAYSPLKGTRLGTYNYREDAQLNFYMNDMGVVMGFNNGDWMKYTVEVAKDGIYQATALYAVPNSSTVLEITFDDKNVISSPLASTDSWTQQGEQLIGTVKLSKGNHIMQYKMLAGGITFKGVKFEAVSSTQKVDFSRKTGSYRNVFIPAVIEAENFDLGAGGSYSSDGKNDGGKYRKSDIIDIYEKNIGKYKIKLNKDEFTKYTFCVEQSDAYTLKVGADTQGVISAFFDDYKQPVTKSVENGAETEIVSVYLEAGLHSITIKSQTDNTEIDYMRFISAVNDYITLDTLNIVKEETPVVTDKEEVKVYRNLYISEGGRDSNTGEQNSPFKTIGRAKEEVAKISGDMDGDIIVNIMSGYYQLSQEETFSERHSGKNGFNVILRGNNRLDPPVISGGAKITGWENTDGKIWKAPADIDDTRTLYINGYAAQRARSKYKYEPVAVYNESGSKYKEDGFTVSTINFPANLTKKQDIELVWDVLWTCQRTPVKDIVIDGETALFLMDQPFYHWARTKDYDNTNPKVGETFYLENAMELLDEPGEFYFNKEEKMIYYYPFNEEDLKTAEAYAGTTEFMFKVSGSDLNNKVSNIVFDNLDFRYGAWNGASTMGVVGVQADKIQAGENDTVTNGGTVLPAQFKVFNAKNIQIQNCRFSSLGSGAISMDNAVSDSKVVGNIFKDCSGTAVIVGHWDHVNEMPEGMQRCVNIEVANNVIRRVSSEFRGGCGISLYYVNSVNVHHNDIKDLPYTGITLGWGWGADIKECANNIIGYNRIEDVTDPTHDGAHIYTLGPIRNSVINDNYCIKAGDYRGGIYADQGTGYIQILNNVIKESKQWLFAREEAGLKEIYVNNNFADTDEMSQDKQNVTVENTTVVRDGNWPKEAADIMNNAGVQAPYKRLLTGVEQPKWRTDFIKVIPKKLYKSKKSGWVEAEDFAGGGEGAGYHKLVQENESKVYRNEGVAIYSQGQNYVIGNTKPGEWLKYSFHIAESGKYNLILKVANAFDKGQPVPRVNISLDDGLIIDKAEIPNNGSWQVHTPVDFGKFELEPGDHTLKIEFDNNGFSFDAWKFGSESKLETDPEFDEGVVVEEQKSPDSFTDIAGHWAENAIVQMAETGVIKGISEKLFAPDDNVSLYQSIWLSLRISNIDFTEDNWKELSVEYGFISEGQEDITITREQFADIIMKTYLVKNKKFKLTYDTSAFTDMADIETGYLDSILGAKELGLMTGDINGKFNPKAYLTRGEAATVIQRMSIIFK